MVAGVYDIRFAGCKQSRHLTQPLFRHHHAWLVSRVEVRPGGPQGDGVGYSDFDGQAATLSHHRAGHFVLCEGPCAALDSAPPVEPPERTSRNRRCQPTLQKAPFSAQNGQLNGQSDKRPRTTNDPRAQAPETSRTNLLTWTIRMRRANNFRANQPPSADVYSSQTLIPPHLGLHDHLRRLGGDAYRLSFG